MSSLKSSTLLLLTHAILACAQRRPKTIPQVGPQAWPQAWPCPLIHVFAARKEGEPPGFGTTGGMINLISSQFPATSEAIDYPACAGQAECGGISYAESVREGTLSVGVAVNKFSQKCPATRLVLVGYSQGAHIMENALCGAGDPGQNIVSTFSSISFTATPLIRAVVLMGSPRWEYSAYYNVGTCRAEGFDPRPRGFVCFHGELIQSYCDSQDPFCCNGTNLEHHARYVDYYNQEILSFIDFKLWEDEAEINHRNPFAFNPW